jgi:hypothetical protein
MDIFYKGARAKKERDRVLYRIAFEDSEGRKYYWMPKWKDLAFEHSRAFLVEAQNQCARVKKCLEEGLSEQEAEQLLRKFFEDIGPFYFYSLIIRESVPEGIAIGLPTELWEKALKGSELPSFPIVEEAIKNGWE